MFFALGAKCGARTPNGPPPAWLSAGGRKQPVVEQGRQRDAADAEAGLFEEMPARDVAERSCFVIVW